MDNELEVIRDEMEQTRANLADKLGALETQVRETVSGATDAVSSTVEGVKDVVSSVSETVESVTDTFNVSKQVEQHPWAALGAAVATGFVVAQVIGRWSQPAPAAVPPHTHPPTYSESPRQAATGAPQQARSEQPAGRQEESSSGLMHSLGEMLPDMSGVMGMMVGNLGGLAVGSLMGVIRELASGALPQEWKGEATKLIDQVTTQLGGKPLDPARSSQLYGALGLSGERQTEQPQGRTSQGVTADPPRQPAGQDSSQAGDGGASRGVRGAARQPARGR